MISPDQTIVDQLIAFGLTEKEAIVYLTAIESGTLPAQQLSKNSGINRSSTYATLELLINKGLIGKSENAAGISVYEVLDPGTLLKEAARMEQRQTEIHQDIDALIPELVALSPTLAQHPQMKFYEGRGGIETALHDLATTKPGEMVRAFTITPIISHRKETQITRVISPYRGGVMPISNSKFLTVHLVPAKQYDFSSDMRIYANKIVLVSEREGFAVIIEDAHSAEMMREIFDLAWEEAGRLDIQIRVASTSSSLSIQ